MVLLTCLALALGACPAFSVAEAVATELTEPGQTAEAIFMVTANPNHAIGAMLELEYDHTALTLIPNELFHQDWVAIGDLAGIPVGKYIKALFRLTDHAQPGTEYQVRLNMKEAYDINEKAVKGLKLSDYTIAYAPTPTATPTPKPKLPNGISTVGDFQVEKVAAGEVKILKYLGNASKLIIPEQIGDCNVISFGDYCFFQCRSLISITIPNSVTSIGASCFSDCESLTNVTIPNGVTSLGNDCFLNCYGLRRITIPNSVTSLGDYCFFNCNFLSSITIPNSVTSLGDYCFLNCASLTSITIPKSVNHIGGHAFYENSSKLTITVTKGSYAETYCKEHSIHYNYQ